jgi:hypothetical protein
MKTNVCATREGGSRPDFLIHNAKLTLAAGQFGQFQYGRFSFPIRRSAHSA